MIPTTYIAVILLSFLSGLTTLIGASIAIYFKKSIKGIVIGIGFSAGIMLLISFFELIPESLSRIGIIETLIAIFLGVLLIGILNFIIPHTHLAKERGKFRKRLLKTAYLVAFGLILHDFPEGFAMANSYIVSPSLGFLIALAIAIHNIPEEFAMAVPIVPLKKKRFLFKVAFLSGLAEPIGAIIGLFAISFLPTLNSFFMSFAAGAMIFVSIHELLPMARTYKKIHLFILGIIISVFIYLVLGILIPE
jgi:ZIP family zinc transporter